MTEGWEDYFYGRAVFSNDFSYYVYPGADRDYSWPNPRTGEAELHVANLAGGPDTKTDVAFTHGFAGTVRWHSDSNEFVFMNTETRWYRVNADEAVEGRADIYGGEGLSLFHDGVRDSLGVPSLSPDGHHLAGVAYLPNEQVSTLLILSEGEDYVRDSCLHGSYWPEPAGTYSVAGAWSPDSRYLAFGVVAGEQSGLYVYDTQSDTIGLVDDLQDAVIAGIVGWGN